MNTFLKNLEDTYNYKFTENGALAMRSTGSKVYDLFAFGAAYRNRSDEDCILLFKRACEEDLVLALKTLFYIRDCRGGQGERRFFRVCLKWLAKNHPKAVLANLENIPDMGRWDDLFVLLDEKSVSAETLHFIRQQLTLDMSDAVDHKAISLLGKWMPSENAHSQKTKALAYKIRTYLGMSSKQYRQMLSKLRAHLNVLERLMSSNRWDEIEFDKIPSKAGLVYRNAFARRDMIAKKYENFAKDNNTKVNADTLYPYEIVHKATEHFSHSYFWDNNDITIKASPTERAMLNKYWENQKDYFNGKSSSLMCVIDTSGSMTWTSRESKVTPIDVAISLGMYCAERLEGPFKGNYISFSSRPQLIKVEGVDFVDKVKRIYKTNLCENTDLMKTFDLLLRIAKNSWIEDIPKTIVVISDMEIDRGARSYDGTELDYMRDKWAAAGLPMPKLVYWNVNARNNTILDHGPNVSFVSGFSPSIFQQVITGKTGIELMLDIILGKRYEKIGV